MKKKVIFEAFNNIFLKQEISTEQQNNKNCSQIKTAIQYRNQEEKKSLVGKKL